MTDMSNYPTIRTVIDRIKPMLPEGFRLVVLYSGSHDSGWFDNWHLEDKNSMFIARDPHLHDAEKIVDDATKAIEEELYRLLESRFPGWEIGDGHVQGSHGYFTIDSATNTIRHNHTVDYNEEHDISPDEEVTF